jgi:hypothetical protein
VTQPINASDLRLVLFQNAGQNHFRTLNPLTTNKFTGNWTPPIKPDYGLWTMSATKELPRWRRINRHFWTATRSFSARILPTTPLGRKSL